MSDAVRSRAPLALLAAAVNAGVFLALMGPAVADTSPAPEPAEATPEVEAPVEAPVEADADAPSADADADAASASVAPAKLEAQLITEAALTPLPDPSVEDVEAEEDALIEAMLPSSHFGGY